MIENDFERKKMCYNHVLSLDFYHKISTANWNPRRIVEKNLFTKDVQL